MPHEFSPVLLFLTQSVLFVALPYLVWTIPRVRALVPLVVVQIMAGIGLGTSVLGAALPEVFELLFPPGSLANIRGLAWIAVTFLAFLTGLHFDLTELRDTSRSFILTSLSSICVPTLLGVLAGWWVWRHLPEAAGAAADATTFSLGMGIAAGVTALPVLGAILREMRLTTEPVGVFALGCAAVNDIALWVLVAGLLALVAGGDPRDALLILTAAVGYVAAMILVVRPLLARLFQRAALRGHVDEKDIVILSGLLLCSSIATEAIGIHYVVGAFTFGAIMPKAVAQDVLLKFESVVTVILLPFFFISTGLRTTFDVTSGAVLAVFVLMSAVSVLGKLAGTIVPARLAAGLNWRDSMALGSLMQCKGLMELVVLTMLLDAEVISAVTFSAMLFMALATTALTKPLVAWARRQPAVAAQPASAR